MTRRSTRIAKRSATDDIDDDHVNKRPKTPPPTLAVEPSLSSLPNLTDEESFLPVDALTVEVPSMVREVTFYPHEFIDNSAAAPSSPTFSEVVELKGYEEMNYNFQQECEQEYKKYMTLLSTCTEPKEYAALDDMMKHYKSLLRGQFPDSKALKYVPCSIDDEFSLTPIEEDMALTHSEADFMLSPVNDDENMHPIYGDISKYNTNDIDTDVE